MTIYYQLSGPSNELKGFDAKTSELLSHDLRNAKRLVVIASNPKDYEISDFYYNRNATWFEKIVPGTLCSQLIDYRIPMDQAQALVQQADFIHLMGGIPRTEFNFIKEYNLEFFLHDNHKVVIGTSAGAMIQSNHVVYHDNSIQSFEGFGFTNYAICPHFSFTDTQRLEEIKAANELGHTVYALPDDSGIRTENNITTFINTVHKFKP